MQVADRANKKSTPAAVPDLELHQRNGAQQSVKTSKHLPPSPIRAPAPAEPSVTLHYATGWQSAYVHGSVGGSQWKDIPLTQVQLFLKHMHDITAG